MLQPDEIIIKKEWQQLSDEEKTQLAELADSEAAFNLLKKMLLVATEETKEVPAISNGIYHQIVKELPARKINTKRYLYAAAAVIAIVVSVSLFFLKKDNTSDFVKSTDNSEKKDSILKKDNMVIQQNIDTASIPNNNRIDSAAQMVQSTQKKKRDIKKSPLYSITDSSLRNVYAVQTTVASNPDLLNFISEAD